MDKNVIKHLGTLAKGLPDLTEEEWKNIFEFLEYFLMTQDNDECSIQFDWVKIKEILALVDKMK